MISSRQIKPAQRRALALRSDATITENDGIAAWRTLMVRRTGLPSNTELYTMEAKFLRDSGGTGNNLLDLWGSFLTTKGMTGSAREKLKSFFKSTTTTV